MLGESPCIMRVKETVFRQIFRRKLTTWKKTHEIKTVRLSYKYIYI